MKISNSFNPPIIQNGDKSVMIRVDWGNYR